MSKRHRQIPDFDANELVSLLLNQPWHVRCGVIAKPQLNGLTEFHVYYDAPEGRRLYLRRGKAPLPGCYWHSDPEDMTSAGVAVLALSQAPVPRAECRCCDTGFETKGETNAR